MRKNYLKFCTPILVLMSIGLFGCSKEKSPLWKEDKPPSQSLLLGVWKVSTESVKLVQTQLPSAPSAMSVTLNPNGSADATNFPYDIGGVSSQLHLVSGGGRWTLERRQAAWKLSLTFDNHGSEMEIRKWKDSMIFTLTLDDPDSNKTIIFEKK